MAEKDLRINEGIRVREVRLIDADGNQKGIVPTFEALQMARENPMPTFVTGSLFLVGEARALLV